MDKRLYLFDSWLEVVFGCCVIGGLVLVSQHNFLMFHSLAEMFSIVVAFAAFVLVAGASERVQSPVIMILGVSFLCIGFLDLMHTLAYKGMGVFAGDDPNLSTQLWIAARGSQALAFVAAGVFPRARINFVVLFWSVIGFTALACTLVLTGHFPTCYVPGRGLTSFKIYSEYAISGMLLLSALMLSKLRVDLGDVVVRLVTMGIVFGVVAELAFTFYVGVYDFSNLVGHVFKVLSFYFIYKAIVETGYARPQELLYRRLAVSEATLSQAQRLVQMGSWERPLPAGPVVWSRQMFRILGYGEDQEPEPGRELLRRHVHPEDWHGLREALDAAVQRGEPFDMELRYVPAEGGVRHARITCDVERDGRGVPVRMFGALRDVTLDKQARQLREDVERITRHDLKTPLNGIIYLTQFLEDTELTEEQARYVREISDSGYKTLDMINQSLDLYRMERGQYELSARTVDLVPVLRRVLRDLLDLASQGRIGVDIRYEGRPLEEGDRLDVRGDELLCYTLLANLVRNALEAAPKGSTVDVVLARQPERRFAVHNQGAVPVQVRERFFDKDATYGKRHGTGLGTYSAKLIAETHGWNIGFNTSLDKGTTVWVEFPW